MDYEQQLPPAGPKTKSRVLSPLYPKTPEGLQQLEADCKEFGYEALAERHGVTHHAVRQHLKRLRAALAKAPATAAGTEPQNPVSAEPQNGIRPFLTPAQWGEIAAWCEEQDDDDDGDDGDDDGRGVIFISRGDWAASHPAESVDEAPPAGLEPAPGFEGLSPREQLTHHLDFLGLGEDGTEFIVDLAPTEGGGHWMRLVRVQRDLQATDSAVFLDVYDDLLTRTKCKNNEQPSGKHLGSHNWLFEAASSGAKDYQNKQFQVFFKPNQFVGRGHTVEAENVLATRAFIAESDGCSLREQWDRAMRLEALGLRFNVLLDSGGKSLHHFIRAPKGMSVDWARDERINKKLCVCINGDPRVINRDRSMRLAGFERQGGRRQALLKGTADQLYPTVEELEATLDRVLLEISISDWEAAFAEIAAKQIMCEQQRQVTAHNGSELGCQWAAWEEAGGWSEGERRVAAAFGGITLTVENLVGLMPKRAADLVKVGSEAGCRNEDGLYLTRELRGVVDVLTDLGVPGMEQLAQGVLDRFIEASGGDVDDDRLFAQYDGAEGAMPGRPVEKFLSSLWYETDGRLGEKKVLLQVRPPNGQMTTEPGLPAAQPLTPSDLAEFPLFVEYALQQQGVRLITVNGLTYRWVETHYALWEKERLVRWLTSLARSQTWRRGDNEENRYHPFLTGGNIANALSWIQTSSEIPANAVNPAGMVNCRNGVLEISWEGRKPVVTLVPHDQDRHFFIDPPGAVYDPDADPKYADQLLECLPEGSRRLFLQIAAATLDIKTVRFFADRVPAMLMIGEGKNGKDTLREALTAIHGKSSVASMSVQDWQSHQAGSGVGRFKATQLEFARLSIASENSGAFKIDNLESLKAAISGDPIYVERKGIDGKDIVPHAAFFFFLNRNPLLDGGGVAILSRYAVAMLPHTYSSNPKPGQLKADTRFKYDTEWVAQNVLPGLLNKMVHHLGEVVVHGFDLTLTEASLQELREETCHLHVFMRETGYVLGDKTESVSLSKFYERLIKWYEQEQWIRRTSFGSMDWAPDDGDQPVKAQRLLGKRLKGLFPSVRIEREPGKARRSRIYGIRRADAMSDED